MNEYEKDVAIAVNKLRLATAGNPISLFGETVTRSTIAGTFRIEGLEGFHAIHATARKIVNSHRKNILASR